MYPSQPVTPQGFRRPAPQPIPGGIRGQQPRIVTTNQPQGATAHNALASFVTYVKALESLDRRHFPEEYADHSDRIKELKPFLKAHGILDVMQIKNPEVAALLGV